MPKALNKQDKEFVASLIQYFERERDNKGPLIPVAAVRERTANALNVSISTVSTISRTIKMNKKLEAPTKKRPRPKPVTGDSITNEYAIRNTIYDMYEKKQHVNLPKLYEALQRKNMFMGSRSSLHNVIRKTGFKCKRVQNQTGLVERFDIVLKRIEFLRAYTAFKEQSVYKFVFLDETWIFQSGAVYRSCSWQGKTSQVDSKRYIILHAGNENGFINGAELVYSSNNRNADENQQQFLRWFEHHVLKNLNEPSIIVMDSASYHKTLVATTPTYAWQKDKIKKWLTSREIEYEPDMLKLELLQLVSRNKPLKVYKVDQLADQYGHKVLPLQPHHCVFSPIEMIWGLTKNAYSRQVQDGTEGVKSIDKCLAVWREALWQIATPQMWASCIQHSEKTIQDWWNREIRLDEKDIMHITSDSDSDSDTDSE